MSAPDGGTVVTEEMLDAAVAWRHGFQVILEGEDAPSMRDQFAEVYRAMRALEPAGGIGEERIVPFEAGEIRDEFYARLAAYVIAKDDTWKAVYQQQLIDFIERRHKALTSRGGKAGA